MTRYIDKEKLLLAFGEEPLVWTDRDDEIQERNDYRYYKALVNGMPIADVEEVRHGKWNDNIIGFCNVCSECGAIVERTAIKNRNGALNYCPNCGAKMDKKG